jgi:NAD(P)-dependent dehydrogenase (short-subunit alcohol dehydrogenase family)
VAVLERDAATGTETAARLTQSEAEARSYEVDVVDEEAVVAVAAQVRADFGRVDALVNNAGIAKLGPSMSCSAADFRETLEVNALGVFLCSREFGKAMRDGEGGSIVNVSSIAGLVAFPMRLAYGATKAGVAHMTRVLACEWADYGIRVNAIAPGMIETEMLRKTIDQGLIDPETYYKRTPQRRFAQPHEMADVVLYLLSDRSRFVTGQVIASDGGWTAFGWIPWSGNPDAPGIAASS